MGDLDRLPQMTSKDMIRTLERLGFVLRRVTGSHHILRHPLTRRIISVPLHSKDLKHGLVVGILKQANIPREEFLKAL